MLKSLSAFLTAAAAIVALAAVSAPASSVTPWQAQHPRHAQINRRLARQSLRIHRGAWPPAPAATSPRASGRS